MTPPTCRHCGRRRVSRPRGLCWRCYHIPGMRERYASTSKYAVRGLGNGFLAPPLDAATCSHLPGSPGRLETYSRRALAGLAVLHPDDFGGRE